MQINCIAIRKEMMKRCIGVNQLAKASGVPANTISKISRQNSRVNLPTLAKIAAALSVDGELLIEKES